jgi:hypothetical protein
MMLTPAIKKHASLIIFSLILATALGMPYAWAQQEGSVPAQAPARAVEVYGPPVNPTAKLSAVKAQISQALNKKIEGLDPNNISSLVFTYWERAAIRDARRARGLARPPTEGELASDMNGQVEDLSIRPPPEERDIKLGGIAYVAANDWTIWLNGQRITPKALPEEALDLKVFDDYIEIKWYDKYTNQVFPIRLRAHQRFNIDTRIFLPG